MATPVLEETSSSDDAWWARHNAIATTALVFVRSESSVVEGDGRGLGD